MVADHQVLGVSDVLQDPQGAVLGGRLCEGDPAGEDVEAVGILLRDGLVLVPRGVAVAAAKPVGNVRLRTGELLRQMLRWEK